MQNLTESSINILLAGDYDILRQGLKLPFEN